MNIIAPASEVSFSPGSSATITAGAWPSRTFASITAILERSAVGSATCFLFVIPRVAVTFDLDGTVLDTRVAFVRAHQLAVRDVLGMRLDEARAVGLMRTGMTLQERMESIEPAAATELAGAFLERYRQERGRVVPYPGLPDLLARLEGRGVRIAIVTSKHREDALVELAGSGLDRRVDAVVAYEDTAEHKPSPAPNLEALRMLDATSGAGVGDAPTDMLSIRAAGLAALGVSWGFGDAESLLASGAESVCRTVRELGEALDERLQSGTNAKRCQRRSTT